VPAHSQVVCEVDAIAFLRHDPKSAKRLVIAIKTIAYFVHAHLHAARDRLKRENPRSPHPGTAKPRSGRTTTAEPELLRPWAVGLSQSSRSSKTTNADRSRWWTQSCRSGAAESQVPRVGWSLTPVPAKR